MKTNLKLKSIYEATKDDVNETVEKYGLKEKVKTVNRKLLLPQRISLQILVNLNLLI